MLGSISQNLLALLASAMVLSKVAAEGLEIETLSAVPEEECIAAKSGDMISVHYAGTLEDGTEFDSSYNRDTPITFQLGAGQVISGWEQGLEGCCIGEKRKLTIPSDLAYGDRGIGPIPPKATLVFITELVDIAGAKKAEKVVKDEL